MTSNRRNGRRKHLPIVVSVRWACNHDVPSPVCWHCKHSRRLVNGSSVDGRYLVTYGARRNLDAIVVEVSL